MDNVTEEKRLQNGNEGDFSITQAQSADIRIQIQEQMPNYSGAAPSEMSLAALAHQIKQKEGRLAIRQEENRSQQATALDSLRLSYGSLQVQREPADSVSLKSQSPSKSENVGSVLNALKSLRNQKIDDTSLQIYRLEYQKKFVIPSACLFFALLAFPLGIGSKRAGRTAGFGIALLLSVIYWALLFAGQTFGYRQNLDPVLSMWMPNLIMFVATAVLWIFRKITKGHFL
jgi:lipopolysaccharide export system permease protein